MSELSWQDDLALQRHVREANKRHAEDTKMIADLRATVYVLVTELAAARERIAGMLNAPPPMTEADRLVAVVRDAFVARGLGDAP